MGRDYLGRDGLYIVNNLKSVFLTNLKNYTLIAPSPHLNPTKWALNQASNKGVIGTFLSYYLGRDVKIALFGKSHCGTWVDFIKNLKTGFQSPGLGPLFNMDLGSIYCILGGVKRM